MGSDRKHRIIIRLVGGSGRGGSRLSRVVALLPEGSTASGEIDTLGITSASVPEGTDLDGLIARIGEEDGVDWVEVDRADHTSS